MVFPFKSAVPRIASSCFVHPSAQVIGDVDLHESASVWCNAVVRGDVNSIVVGRGTNIQDNCVLHVEHAEFPLRIGEYVTTGHNAVLHGCTVDDECVIGIGAIVLNGAVIGRGSVVAAGALVPEGARIAPGSLVMGVPGRVMRQVSADEATRFRENALHYIELAQTYREGMA